MNSNISSFWKGFLSFVIVLLFMPIGHALMVANEKILGDNMFAGAFVIGFLGLIALVTGILKNENYTHATLWGLLAGILVWTGWVEFSFVWIAGKLNVAPQIENGEVSTKPEYLVMMSSLGLLLTLLTFFILRASGCKFFVFIQKITGIKNKLGSENKKTKLFAVITFIETIMLLWFFYIVLLLIYDKDIAGDKHPVTFAVAFGSLLWSIYLFLQLIKITKFDYSLRYAIPTVIIFWNFIEIIGRWNLFKEIWVHPFEHWVENLTILILLIGFTVYYFIESRKKTIEQI
ncbi:MAG: hypothetical protein IT243_07470 [Bacteroidia bacterium]|nr:hypothetical protein [Bacteroidia bacterium]